ncbi:MAG: hypothetical protein LBH92_01090 [Bacteroidales bacterium]|jgi:hypothetical protein|nr:hypothetical protein [Bacteroidales bacterium]
MKLNGKLLIIFVLILGIASCKSKEQTTTKSRTSKAEQTAAKPEAPRSGETRNFQKKGDGLFGENALSGISASRGSQATAPVVIYKTKNDYSNYIMVALDDSKTKVVSYPSARDAKMQIPDSLGYGFWLDKRGIKPNMVVLQYTVQQWMTIDPFPSQETMLANILDDAPFEEIYYCGKRGNYGDNINAELNKKLQSVEGKAEEIFTKAR